ncbi:putative membrane protein [Pseudonocardia sp. Ae168_Ps1]|uniref:hypothetical protein n=1 Tax=unclassified Pseudonocardia TaxID=2619320 RepID=UPI00094ABA4F|nr:MULTISPECIES: hypothetical protein [unclassified Pseudonocardia]OLL69943.1 putative membrane protein [Pseudonocardia sp. Ae168_Ps1]OLL69996.1 putative membrane protein [Pseudonocardia sp. Ae263_Ps1]OLL89012.1 putative membrane protein [Pseudonocardia sp. Ae356_Ps1]
MKITSADAGSRSFYAVSALSLLVSADTSWRAFGLLGVTQMWERAALFLVAEVALIACGVAMRAGVRRSGQPGPARWLAWGICAALGVAAVWLSGPVGGALRVALGPVLGVLALHLALGIELRAHRPAVSGTWARVAAELRERALSRIGLADDGRTALARTRDRAAHRAARLALAGRSTPWRRARLARALRASHVAHDDTMRARMLDELAAVRHADALRTLDQPSPWEMSRADDLGSPITAAPEATATDTSHGEADEWASLRKSDAIRRALTEAPDQSPREITRWLAARGVEVAPSQVTDTVRRDRAKTPPDLRIAG